jgi:hypothetical protein
MHFCVEEAAACLSLLGFLKFAGPWLRQALHRATARLTRARRM